MEEACAEVHARPYGCTEILVGFPGWIKGRCYGRDCGCCEKGAATTARTNGAGHYASISGCYAWAQGFDVTKEMDSQEIDEKMLEAKTKYIELLNDRDPSSLLMTKAYLAPIQTPNGIWDWLKGKLQKIFKQPMR